MMVLQGKIQKKITSVRTNQQLQNIKYGFRIQGSQPLLYKTDKSWTKGRQKAVPVPLGNCSADNSQHICCAEQDTDLYLPYSKTALYL